MTAVMGAIASDHDLIDINRLEWLHSCQSSQFFVSKAPSIDRADGPMIRIGTSDASTNLRHHATFDAS